MSNNSKAAEVKEDFDSSKSKTNESESLKRKKDELYDPTQPDSSSDDDSGDDDENNGHSDVSSDKSSDKVEPVSKFKKITDSADSTNENAKKSTTDADTKVATATTASDKNGSTAAKTSSSSSSVTIGKIATKPTQLPTGNLAPSSSLKTAGVVKNVSEKVAKVFGEDDDDEDVEEMPFEARMKMRNIGRNTPTSTGPNSYGKTNMGFTDQRKLFEKQLKEKADELLKEEMAKKRRAANASSSSSSSFSASSSSSSKK